MGLHQTKKLLHSEENYQQNDKAAHWRDDIYKQYIQSGLMYKISLNIKTKKPIQLKTGQRKPQF